MGIHSHLNPLNTSSLLTLPPSIQNKSNINNLPNELLVKIFNLVLNEETLSLVCKTWREIINATHPLNCLKKGEFKPYLLQGPVSTFVQDLYEYGRFNTLIGSWMNKQIKQLSGDNKKYTTPPSSIVSKCSQFFNSLNFFRDKSLNTDNALEAYDEEKIAEQHEIFILDNLLLTTFDTHLPCTNKKVNKWINICKSLNIEIYNPKQHLKKILETINPDEISPKIWEEAFRIQLLFLESIPEEKRTQAICLAAVKQNDLTLQFVPKIERTEAIYLAALTQNGWRLVDIPEIERTQAICLVAVTQNGLVLRYVPEIEKTEAICLAAVTQNGEALEHVPKTKKTRAICVAAVKQNRVALEYVPEIERNQLFA